MFSGSALKEVNFKGANLTGLCVYGAETSWAEIDTEGAKLNPKEGGLVLEDSEKVLLVINSLDFSLRL